MFFCPAGYSYIRRDWFWENNPGVKKGEATFMNYVKNMLSNSTNDNNVFIPKVMAAFSRSEN